jgi:transcriptional regulator with XRE-family HTH domain
MTTPKPATMAQIAEQSGVALSTVSYVLSGKRPVSAAMRKRVLAQSASSTTARTGSRARSRAATRARSRCFFPPRTGGVTPPAKPTDARERVALPSARTLTPTQSA